MFTCNILLGYDPEFAVPATLTATATELVIKEVGCNPVTLTPNEVVSFDVEGWIPFVTQVVLVRHVAFNKIGKVVMMPTLSTCRKMIAGIRTAGFIPQAAPRVA